MISNCEIRYEGILHSVDINEGNMSLTKVRAFGTEGRRHGQDEIPPSDGVYEYIVFNAGDIKDLNLLEPDLSKNENFKDPAILTSRLESHAHDHRGDASVPRGSSNVSGNKDDSRHQASNRGNLNEYRGGARGFYDSAHPRERRGGYRGGRGHDYGNSHPRNHREGGGRGGGSGFHRQRQDGRTGQEFLMDERGQKDAKEQFADDFDFTRGKEEFEKKKKEFEQSNENKVPKAYNKSASFFDHISCDQNENRIGREVMKKTDTETFGSDLVGNMRSFRRRGRYRR